MKTKDEEILHIAAQMFADKGYEKMDVQKLADALGIGKGTVYRHFFSKQELFLATADRVIQLLGQSIEEQSVNITDPIEKMKKAFKAFFAFFEKHPALAEMLIQDRAVFKERQDHTYFQYREQMAKKWQNYFEELIQKKILRNISAEKMVHVFTTFLYGALYVRFFTEHQYASFQQAEDALDMIFNGILNTKEL
ncbi:MAG: TetR/AcrR family transcriptional regulator [Chlamydiota bacterium]